MFKRKMADPSFIFFNYMKIKIRLEGNRFKKGNKKRKDEKLKRKKVYQNKYVDDEKMLFIRTCCYKNITFDNPTVKYMLKENDKT